jgi:hypothetical protein
MIKYKEKCPNCQHDFAILINGCQPTVWECCECKYKWNPNKGKKTLWIRPVYIGTRLSSYALATTNDTILVDQQILEHFPISEPGSDVTAAAIEFHGATHVIWGKPIHND